jgi:peroxiredoxin Q/BCP
MPQTGMPAPDIHAEATGDGPFDLTTHRGAWVVVYFFPRSNTPG